MKKGDDAQIAKIKACQSVLRKNIREAKRLTKEAEKLLRAQRPAAPRKSPKSSPA